MSHRPARFPALALTVATCAALTACSGPAAAPSGAEAPATDAPVTITYKSWSPSQESMDKVVAAFEAANTGVTVEATLLPYADYLTALKTELSTGTGPDVFGIQAGGMLKEFQTLLTPIDEVAATLGADWKAKYKTSALDQASIDGVVYGFPDGLQSAGMLWVNNDLLKANGLAVPTTYDEFVAAGQTLRAAGVVPMAVGAKDDWMLIDIFSSMSNAIAPGEQYAAMDGQGPWTTDGLVKTFDAFATMFIDGVAMDGATGAATYSDTYDLFADGKAAFFTNGSWNQDMFVGAADRIGKFEASVALMPTVAGPAPVTAGIASIFAVNKTSEHAAVAAAFADFMAAGEGAQIQVDGNLNFASTTTEMTPNADLSENALAVRQQLTDQLNKNLAGYREVPNAAVKTALGQELVKLAAGWTDAAAAAAAVQAAADGQ